MVLAVRVALTLATPLTSCLGGRLQRLGLCKQSELKCGKGFLLKLEHRVAYLF